MGVLVNMFVYGDLVEENWIDFVSLLETLLVSGVDLKLVYSIYLKYCYS